MCGYAKDTLGRSATPQELAEQLARALDRYHDEPYREGLHLRQLPGRPGSRPGEPPRDRGGVLGPSAGGSSSRRCPSSRRRSRCGRSPSRSGVSSRWRSVSRRPTRSSSGATSTRAPPGGVSRRRGRIGASSLRAKAYLLLKPPYLAEAEAIDDIVRSVGEAAQPHFDALSVNPVHIQNGTVVEWLLHRRQYRPPWLWSVVSALSQGAVRRGTSRLVSFPTAGGLARGPHNCGKCDARVLAAIEEALAFPGALRARRAGRVRVPRAVGGRVSPRAARGRSMSGLVPRLPSHAEATVHRFLRSHALSGGAKGVAVGLSGGIDSALVAPARATRSARSRSSGCFFPPPSSLRS